MHLLTLFSLNVVLWSTTTSVLIDKRRRREVFPAELDHCPNGAVRHDNSCYIISHLLANWPEARVYCEAYAGHLLFIETDREQRFLSEYLKNVSSGSTDPHHYYWIGGTDALSEGEWFWAKSLQPVKYTNWAPGNPNNADNLASHHQDCMAIYGTSGQWDDGYCETQHNFICEIELQGFEVVG